MGPCMISARRIPGPKEQRKPKGFRAKRGRSGGRTRTIVSPARQPGSPGYISWLIHQYRQQEMTGS